MDIKLLQTFKKINMQSAMKLHDSSKGLVPTASTSALHVSPSGNTLRHENTFSNFSQLIAAKLVEFYMLNLFDFNFFYYMNYLLASQNTPYLT